jgi:hypothetical protein
VIALAIRTPAAWIRDRATLQAWLVIAEPGFEPLLETFEKDVRTCAELGARRRRPPEVRDPRRTIRQFLEAVSPSARVHRCRRCVPGQFIAAMAGAAPPAARSGIDLCTFAKYQSQSVRSR